MIYRHISPRARKLSLRVDYKAGHIRLTTPPNAKQEHIHRFLERSEGWIRQREESLQPKVMIKDGASIPFKGTNHVIKIGHHLKRSTDISIIMEGEQNVINIKTSRADPTTNLKRWMIDQAGVEIEKLCTEKSAILKKKFKSIALRDTVSRWGSCSSDKRLMFSWRLMMAPPNVLDYVVAHEVSHLKHMDHSKKFWRLCYDLSDNPEEARAWLKNEGNGLFRYF